MTHFGCGPERLAGMTLARACSMALGAASCSASLLWPGAALAGVGPTVQEVVEFTRLIQPRDGDADELRAQISPDGTRAFVVTRKAAVARDVNRYEILLLDVRPGALASGRHETARTILSVDAADDQDDIVPAVTDVRWAGDRDVVFRARMGGRLDQAYRVDVASGQVTQLTFDTRPVVSFAVSDDFRRIVYAVQVPHPPMAAGARSVVAANQSFWSVKFGQNLLRSQDRHFQYMTVAAGDVAAHPLSPPTPAQSGFYQSVSLSPDGKWALLPRFVPSRQAEWAGRYPLIGALTSLIRTSGDVDPLGYFSQQTSFTTRTTVARRLSDGHEQLVVDAPDDAYPGVGQVRPDKLWLGGGRSVVIAGTFLPPGADGTTSVRSHVIEYRPDMDRWTDIAELEGRAGAVTRLDGGADAFEVVDGERHRRFRRTADGRWEESLGEGLVERAGSSGPWALSVRERLNLPPDVYAVDGTGHERRLTDLNPQYNPATWGSMRPFVWTDGKGRRWDGGLMTPNGDAPSGPRPLVIQTYGFSSERFYLDGANEYDGYTSGFAGRAFLRDDILVLGMPFAASTGPAGDSRDRSDSLVDGVRSAVDALVAAGIVDRDRVGIMGWSATGEDVLNLVTFSGLPIRAATLLDGDANTLFSLTVTYGAADSIWSRKERANRGLPFGVGRPNWIRSDPSLHTECVRAAMRIETYGPWVENNWDIYALLRRQYKPAEMVVIPDGAHSLSRPSERMLSLQGNVDWYGFWLRGTERHTPFLIGEDTASLANQYARWRQMAELKRIDDARAPCETSGRH